MKPANPIGSSFLGTFCRSLPWAEGRRCREQLSDGSEYFWEPENPGPKLLQVASYCTQFPYMQIETLNPLYCHFNETSRDTCCNLQSRRSDTYRHPLMGVCLLLTETIEEIREEAEHKSQSLAPGRRPLPKSNLSALRDFTLFSSQS